MDGWIVVRNWDRFQHYKDREPVWIKLYLELRDRDDWGDLSWAQRGLLVSVWMEFGASRGVLRASSVSQRCRQKTRKDTLASLVSAGFIDIVASKPLALARSREDIDLGEDKDLKDLPPPAPKHPNPPELPTAFTRIARMIANGVIHDEVDLEAELRAGKQRLNANLEQSLHDQLRRRIEAP